LQRIAQTRARLLLPLILLALAGFGQQSSNNPAHRPAAKAASSTVSERFKPKLTPQQKEGLRLLKAAQAEADGLTPDMSAFVLWKAASAYGSTNRSIQTDILRRAFLATLTIESPVEGESCPRTEICGVKSDLQYEILQKLLELSRGSAEELLSSAEPEIRENIADRISEKEFADSLRNKNFERARELISEHGDDNYFSYSRATKIIEALPENLSANRLVIFSEAVHNFEQQRSGNSFPSVSEELSRMIVDTWPRLPSPAVLAAITEILDRAKTESQESTLHTTITTTHGAVVSLNSPYEARLFQLLPVLSELAPAQAESLLHDNENIRSALGSSPRGMQSMETMTMESGPPSPHPDLQSQAEIAGRINAVIDKAAKSPKQALSEALGLPLAGGVWPPDGCPRLSALEAIVRTAAKKDRLVAESALREIMNLAEQLSPIQYHQLGGVLSLYSLLGDEEGEKNAVKILAKLALKLYDLDSDKSNPNLAFKGFWPSTALWRRCVLFAGKLSPALADAIISDIPDPNIAAIEKVVHASSLLGVNTGSWDIAINYRTSTGTANNFMTADE